MRSHSWVREVLLDLEQYASQNELPEDLNDAVVEAARRAKGNMPVVHTDFVPIAGNRVLQ